MLCSVSRNPSHFTQRSSSAATWRRLSAIGVLLTAALSSTPSAADGGDIHVSTLEPDKMEVDSNGTEYTAISGHPLAGLYSEIYVYLEGGVRSWSVHLTFYLGDKRLPMPDYRVGRHYDDPVDEVHRTEPLVVPQEAYRDWIVAQCNSKATALRAAGESNKTIFGQDRKYTVSVKPDYTYDFVGVSKVLMEGSPRKTIEVTCKKWSGIAVPQASDGVSAVPTVNSASLEIFETSGPSGVCMIKLSGIVRTSSPYMEVRYHYEDGDGHKSDIQTVTTDHSSTVLFLHEYDIPNNTDGREKGKVRMVGDSHAFKSAWADYKMHCVEPGATDLSASLPPTLTLSVAAVPNNTVMINGQVCPKQVRLAGKIKGNGHFHGYAVFHGTSYLSPPQTYEVENGDTDWVFALYDLKWEHDINQFAAPDTDDEPMQQTIKFGFNVNGSDTPGAHVKVKHQPVATVPLKSYKFACQWPKLTPGVQGGSGGLTGQLPAPPAQQQNGQALAANPQLATAVLPFSIQSPRGMVQQGVIRLQGVADKKAKFVLSWFARKNGAYKAVHASGLPEAMTGTTAKFDVKALAAASAWRLKVCPQAATAASACQQTDFKGPALQN